MQVFGSSRTVLPSCLVFCVALGLSLVGWGQSPARGQTLFGIADPTSPFLLAPALQGEAQITPILIGVSGGKNSIPSLGISWKLKGHFGMSRDHLFLDTWLRFTLGRLSVWAAYEPREFVGEKHFTHDPNLNMTEARFDFSGIQVGGGVDIFVGYGARVGVNLDYYCYRPVFQESIWTRGGKKIIGEAPFTLGAHAAYNPMTNWYGLSGVFDARARWSVQGSTLFDLELSAGLKAPDTVIGSWALKGGYRTTSMKFNRSQIYNNAPVPTQFDIQMDGWFGQLAYYY